MKQQAPSIRGSPSLQQIGDIVADRGYSAGCEPATQNAEQQGRVGTLDEMPVDVMNHGPSLPVAHGTAQVPRMERAEWGNGAATYLRIKDILTHCSKV
jgi:hypothetical protein